MKRITSMIAGPLFAILIASGSVNAKLNAQDERGELFTVPFAFSVEGHNVAAGTYEVRLVSSERLLSIRNAKTGGEQFFNVLPQEQRAVASEGLLIFHRCGVRKDLTEFHIPGTNLYSSTIPLHRSGNLEAENCSPAETMTVAAR